MVEPIVLTILITAPGYEDHTLIVGLEPEREVPEPPEEGHEHGGE